MDTVLFHAFDSFDSFDSIRFDSIHSMILVSVIAGGGVTPNALDGQTVVDAAPFVVVVVTNSNSFKIFDLPLDAAEQHQLKFPR
jgi:hypothetical protein